MPENRMYPRYRIIVDIKIHLNKKEIMAAAFNISQGGIRFVTNKKIEMNSVCTIEFVDAKGISLVRGGQIVFIEAVYKHPDMQKYGFQFAVPLSASDLMSIRKKLGVPEKDKDQPLT